MMVEGQKYIVYGLSPQMQDLIKTSMVSLRDNTLKNVLTTILNDCSLSQDEKNLVLFELGREYERKKYVG